MPNSVPSGPSADLQSLRQGLLEFGLKLGRGVGRNGRPYHWMLDCRELLLQTSYLKLAAREIWNRIKCHRPDFVAGMTLAANPLTIAVMYESQAEGCSVDGLLIRREPKADGLKKLVEGPAVWPGARVVLLDDIVHSGDTQKQALAALAPLGVEVVAVAAVVDCDRAGSQWLRSRGLPLETLFTLADLGLAPQLPGNPGLLQWEWKAGPINARKNGIVKSAPVVSDEAIFVGSDMGFVAAFGIDGNERWRYLVRDTVRGVHATPRVVGGRVIFGAYDGYLYCLNRVDGQLVWETRLGQWIGSSPAIIPEAGLVCVGVESGEAGGALAAVELETGVLRWQFAAKGYVHGSPIYDAARRRILFGANDCTLYALDLQGSARWQFVAEGEIKATPVVDAEGRCFFGSFDGSLYALNAEDGTLLWSRRAGTCVYFTPLVVEDLVIVGGDSHRLIACSRKTGQIRWVSTAGGAIRGGAVRIGSDVVAFGAGDGVLYLLDRATGRCIDRFNTGDEITAAPACAEGRLFVSSLDGFLYSFAVASRHEPVSEPSGQLRHFRRLRDSVDLNAIRAELERNQDLWLTNTTRQSSIPVQRETHSIGLRTADLRRNPGKDINDVHDCRTSANADAFPAVMNLLVNFARDQNAALQRAMLVRLQPHGRVYPHVDKGTYYATRDRYHLVIDSPSGSSLSSGGEAVVMREGELWWFDNKATHESKNDSEQWRVHLIFDLLPNPKAVAD